MGLVRTCKHCGKKLFFVYYEAFSPKHEEGFITVCKSCKDLYHLPSRKINILSDIVDEFLYLKWTIKETLFEFRMNLERIEHNVSKEDIWNFNEVLPKILRRAVRYHRIYGSTYPSDFKDYKEWKKILREMELGFKILEEYYKTIEDCPSYTMPEKHREKVDKAFELLKKYHWSLWD
ncbi:MAG: hypothetical protein DSY42_04935 [Aquifex sp.]|nr:MAG: hypothetical protein DSY42_04935 [Aquifex sp.]